MASATYPPEPDPPNRGRNREGAGLDSLEGALVRTFEAQTLALREELRSLASTFGSGLSDLRAEARSTRLWVVGLVGLSIVVLGSIVGVDLALSTPALSLESEGASPPENNR